MTLTAGTDVEIVFLKITGKGINYKGKSPPPAPTLKNLFKIPASDTGQAVAPPQCARRFHILCPDARHLL